MRAACLCGMVLVLATALPAAAQVAARVGVSEVVVGQPFDIVVKATGEQASPVPPQATDDVEVARSPHQTARSMETRIVNNQIDMTRGFTWVFRATALREGTITIPPFTINVDGEQQQTEALQVTATKGAPRSPDVVQRRPAQPSVDDVVLLETEVDKREVYQGERVRLFYRVWKLDRPGTTIRFTGGRIPAPPETQGFYATDIRRNVLRRERDSVRYEVEEFSRDLYPTRDGTLTIGSWNWTGIAIVPQRFAIAQRHEVVKDAAPVEVTVKPLPARPDNFSGAVGQYRATASLASNTTQQGVPVDFTVRITGRGNPAAVNAPPLPELPWAQVSGPRIDLTQSGQGDNLYDKMFVYSLVPLESGTHTVPPVAFCYFEPNTGVYRTEETAAAELAVAATGDAPRLVTAGGTRAPEAGQVEILADDLQPIVTSVAALNTWRPYRVVDIFVFAGPPFAFLGLSLLALRQRRFRENPDLARAHFARSNTARRLAAVPHSDAPADALYEATTHYLADKLGAHAAGMTSADARELLHARGVDETLIAGFDRVLRKCERARYASATLSPQEVRAMTDAVHEQINALDRALAGRARA